MRLANINSIVLSYVMIKVLCLAVAMLAAAVPANAAMKSGNDLLAECTGLETQLVCIGYIEGVVDMSNAPGKTGPGDGLAAGPIKTPRGVTAGQMTDIVVKFLKEHPEQRQFMASDLVYIALQIAYKK